MTIRLARKGFRGYAGRMERRVTLAWWAVGAIVLVLAVRLASRDDPPSADADILPAAYAPGADDGYPVFVKLTAASTLSTKDVGILLKQLETETPDEALVSGYAARSTETLALFGELSRRPAFSDPHFSDPATSGPETPIPQFFAVVGAARLISLQAGSLLKKGRAPEAMARALTIIEAGRALMRGHPQLIEYLVGVLVLEIGAKRALAIVKSGTLDRARLVDAAARLAEPSGAAAGLQAGLRFAYAEQVYMLGHFGDLATKGPESRYTPRNLAIAAVAKGGWYVYMPHRTRALFAARFRPLVAAAGEPCMKAKAPPFEILPVGWRPNLGGRVLYDIAIPAYEKLSTRRCETDFRLTAASVAAALRVYRQDHGRLPARLDELTPRYLAAPPIDPFSGEAPLYSPKTGEVRSAMRTLGVAPSTGG